jgi:polyhydroxyalkanoate synthase
LSQIDIAENMTTEGIEGHPYAVKDPEVLARNLARVVEEVGKAASAYLKAREEEGLLRPVRRPSEVSRS